MYRCRVCTAPVLTSRVDFNSFFPNRMNVTRLRPLLTYAIAAVWFVNGLYAKVLNGVPRHEQIVARILGPEHAFVLTKAIGVSEVLMAVWIVSRIRPRWCALAQMLLVATMNTLEIVLAPDLLLFGRLNGLYALLFVGVVYYDGFVLTRAAHLPS